MAASAAIPPGKREKDPPDKATAAGFWEGPVWSKRFLYHTMMPMKYINLLFDLDGTLTNPYPGITNAIQYALKKLHIHEEDPDTLKLFIGPPLEKSFSEYYSFDRKTSRNAVKYYREYFSEKGIYENTLYDEVENVLKTLNSKNKQCMVATSKPEIFAYTILEYFHISAYFKDVVGSNMEGTFVEKEDIIRHIIEKYTLNRTETIMIGDRKYDILGAHKNGIDSIGVLYGYGSKEELEQASPTYVCPRVTDIVTILA
ncbi:MAG: HAD hydrolase-like protein [Treponema sp.]|jgi:phosphoglycolate phosphatase|nr:HAD hydrolase-like protein [Treponema sp.]